MSGGIVMVVAAAALGWLLPWAFVRMLVPSLASTEKRSNYRGREVYLGLGLVWLVWAGCALAGGALAATVDPGSVLVVLAIASPLSLVAFSLGIVDDSLGSGADRGFKGHVRALMRGRMTTGGLKLIGMGLVSLVVAVGVSGFAVWGGYEGAGAALMNYGIAVIAAAAIALTTNFVNLTDLRPGRALKAYSALAVVGSVLAAVTLSGGLRAPAGRVTDLIALLVFMLGPVAAVWRYDLGELGMLGDAGANPMGAVAGLVIAVSLPLVWLIAYTALMLVLNLASERVSFSAVIERTAFLRSLDALGRTGGESSDSVESSQHPGPVAE